MFDKKNWKIIEPWFYLMCYGFIFLLFVMKFDTVYSFVTHFFSILTPLYIGLGIAFVLNVPMKRIEGFIIKKFPSISKSVVRSISIILSIVLAILVFVIAVVSIVPELVNSLVTLVSNVETYITNIVRFINTLLGQFNVDYRVDLNALTVVTLDQYMNEILTSLQAMANAFGTTLLTNVKDFTSTLGNVFMGFMLSIYLLGGKETFLSQAKKVVIAVFGLKNSRKVLDVANKANDIFESFVGGQLVEMVVLALIFYVGLTIFRMPYALLISVITGISGIIPILGAMMSMVFGCILILGINPVQVIWFIILYQTLQQFENNVVYPRVVGKSVGLSGIWVLLSIIVFGDLLGALGMILAVPIMAVIYSLVSEFVNNRVEGFQSKQKIEMEEE